jgi:hypothetical protein
VGLRATRLLPWLVLALAGATAVEVADAARWIHIGDSAPPGDTAAQWVGVLAMLAGGLPLVGVVTVACALVSIFERGGY